MMRELLEGNLPFFSALDEGDQEDLCYLSYPQRFESGEIVLTPNDPCENLIIVLEGRIKSLLVDGRHSLLLYYLNIGDICTLASSPELFSISRTITLVAETDCQILKIPAYLFARLREKYPQLTVFLRRNFMDRFADILYCIEEKAFDSPTRIVATYLYDLSLNHPDEDIIVTQETISRETSVARSLVSSILSHFSTEGIIERFHGKISIKDPDRLRNI